MPENARDVLLSRATGPKGHAGKIKNTLLAALREILLLWLF
uniref:Uncharacterized protein n=1 Tax=Anguilla anguilla TaxID=7936 RepID=A0A0E9R4U8_ANGAN